LLPETLGLVTLVGSCYRRSSALELMKGTNYLSATMSDEWSSSGDDVNANGEKSSMILWKMKLMMLQTMVFMYLIFG
jgi:hypothetical protein